MDAGISRARFLLQHAPYVNRWHRLNDVQQPENDDDEKDGAESAAATVTPVAGVRENGEGAEQQKDENDDDDEFQGEPPEIAVPAGRCLEAAGCYLLSCDQIIFDGKQRRVPLLLLMGRNTRVCAISS